MATMIESPMEHLTFGVYPTLPPRSLVRFQPSTNPVALPPPESDRTFARPFNISPEIYGNLLHVAWPISIAVVYALAVRYISGVNKRRDHKPWAFSKSQGFYIFVVLHNVGLTIFSGWVFAGMINAVRNSWPGWDGEYGLAGAADALCKLHGPRGTGSAATYSTQFGIWSFTDEVMKLAEGQPDSSDVGRIWNEGLAFYGFIFYLSKFYEVVDTAIILAKGKSSSQLQTFHHAGAMLCMWAGIRYMSPPIWMFTFINSGIHTLMYTYYTLAALTVPVPIALKRILTFLQINQILFGATYAILHLFVAYDIPVATPVVFAHNLSTVLPSAASAVTSAATSLATSANIEAWLKKWALRAAGEEGLAENVRNYKGETFGIDAVHAAEAEKAQEEIRYKIVTRRVNCLDTSGEVFAILLNAVYLAPLAYLFISFFVQTYIRGSKSKPVKPTVQQQIKASTKETLEAANATADKIEETIQDPQGGTSEPPPELRAKLASDEQKQVIPVSSSDVKDEGEKVDQQEETTPETSNSIISEPDHSDLEHEQTASVTSKETTEEDNQNGVIADETETATKDPVKSSGEDPEQEAKEIVGDDVKAAEETADPALDKADESQETTEAATSSVKQEAESVNGDDEETIEAIRDATESPMQKTKFKMFEESSGKKD